MQCPVCNVELRVSERSGVEIDYCPQCRGVWLDRGELDKIIQRAGEAETRHRRESYDDGRAGREYREDDRSERERYAPQGYAPPQPNYPPQQPYPTQQPQGYDPRYPHRKRKRGGLLGELFDFS